MKNTLPILALLFLAAASFAAAAMGGHPQPASKPRAPFNVHIEALGQPILGEIADFRVTLHSALDAAMVLTVTLPQGAELISGEVNWQGQMRPGQPKVLEFSARLPRRGKPLIQVEAVPVEGGGFAARDRLVVGPSVQPKVRSEPPRTGVRHGQPIKEFPAR